MTLRKRDMQSCDGCQFLVRGNQGTYLCRATDHSDTSDLPTAFSQRVAGGACGPEAVLYQPTWWHRVRTWWTNGPI